MKYMIPAAVSGDKYITFRKYCLTSPPGSSARMRPVCVSTESPCDSALKILDPTGRPMTTSHQFFANKDSTMSLTVNDCLIHREVPVDLAQDTIPSGDNAQGHSQGVNLETWLRETSVEFESFLVFPHVPRLQCEKYLKCRTGRTAGVKRLDCVVDCSSDLFEAGTSEYEGLS
jgi:hypothetical protein